MEDHVLEQFIAAVEDALQRGLDDFSDRGLRELREEIRRLCEHVHGNGRPGLVQEVALLEERHLVLSWELQQARRELDRLYHRLYGLVLTAGLSLLGAVLSFVLR